MFAGCPGAIARARPLPAATALWQPLAASRRCAKTTSRVTTRFFLAFGGAAPVCRARREEGGGQG